MPEAPFDAITVCVTLVFAVAMVSIATGQIELHDVEFDEDKYEFGRNFLYRIKPKPAGRRMKGSPDVAPRAFSPVSAPALLCRRIAGLARLRGN